MWFNTISPGFLILLNFLQFRVVLQSCSKATGMMKVTGQGVFRMPCDGYKSLLLGWFLWLPQKPPKGAAVWIEKYSFKMPHLPVTYHPWITDMAIKAYQVRACLRKGLSRTSTHMQ